MGIKLRIKQRDHLYLDELQGQEQDRVFVQLVSVLSGYI